MLANNTWIWLLLLLSFSREKERRWSYKATPVIRTATHTNQCNAMESSGRTMTGRFLNSSLSCKLWYHWHHVPYEDGSNTNARTCEDVRWRNNFFEKKKLFMYTHRVINIQHFNFVPYHRCSHTITDKSNAGKPGIQTLTIAKGATMILNANDKNIKSRHQQ